MDNENENKPLTRVFVDYEHWFWGLYNQYGETPNLKPFVSRVKQRGCLEEINVFGDFSKEEMSRERPKIRTVTNNIIDCVDESTKKDHTDFIILDHIYRTILQRKDVEQYVLVTGDGHFHNVVAYLNTILDKTVGIYGVKGQISGQLRASATWCEELLPEKDNDEDYRNLILQSIEHAEKCDMTPTFSGILNYCSQHYDRPRLAAALRKLIEEGYITQVIKTLPNGSEVRALVPKWELMAKHEIWNPREEVEIECRGIILASIHRAERNGKVATFRGTVNYCSQKYDRLRVAGSLSRLIREGYVRQEIRSFATGSEVRVLVPKWDLVFSDGLWGPEESKKNRIKV